MHAKNHDICRYTHGLWCETCNEFFPKDSEVYLRYEYISSLFMVVHNIGVEHPRSKKAKSLQCRLLNFDSINQPIEEVNKIKKEALIFINRFGKNDESATIVLAG